MSDRKGEGAVLPNNCQEQLSSREIALREIAEKAKPGGLIHDIATRHLADTEAEIAALKNIGEGGEDG